MFVYPIVCSFKQSNSSTRTRSENWLTTQNKVIFSKITIKLVEMILSKPWATTGTIEMGRELFEYKRTPCLNKGMTLDSFLAREQALHFGDSREFTRETRAKGDASAKGVAVFSRGSLRLLLGNLSTRRSWFTNGMAGRAELDRGRALRAKCNSLSKTTWNHHERRQNNSVENAFQRFALSFVSFFQRKHDFRGRISTFVWRILFEEPRIWTSGFNLKSGLLKSVTAAQERLDMRCGCHAAKILPFGVRGTKNVWCLSSLIYLKYIIYKTSPH